MARSARFSDRRACDAHGLPETPFSASFDTRDTKAVEQAALLFLDEGIAAVPMTRVAHAAGVGVATLYRHFATKADLAVRAATLLWYRFNLEVNDLVISEAFRDMSGLEMLDALTSAYRNEYLENPRFVAFIDELDRMLLTERVDQSALACYDAQIDSFYFVFEEAYRSGRTDGSIRRDVDFRLFYRSVAHALLGVAQKLSRGELIPSDDFSLASNELHLIADMAVTYLGGTGSGDCKRGDPDD
ncbi:regulatory protein TetR [Coriobacterium glomerans PW2]|uniref:Regulatory protein TetR n=1 Tax=Coriobacterium glomerans (strain ATCC 49209 / DSM 20642 / JCM 10262 / PW2) TaxID=700015 RepID=F2NAN1_CORGP|nr:TetR/AcrR family transcriptional regulator [Coriobacterium glomerans]AEB07487.1 regulatory protein TetR [Coriobacterium glomerans PW2]